jgi:preprotein translocase subunit YajC
MIAIGGGLGTSLLILAFAAGMYWFADRREKKKLREMEAKMREMGASERQIMICKFLNSN